MKGFVGLGDYGLFLVRFVGIIGVIEIWCGMLARCIIVMRWRLFVGLRVCLVVATSLRLAWMRLSISVRVFI